MLSLKNHPFAVKTFFETSLVLTYAIPKEQVELLIPPCLKLDTFDDKWAFVAVAIVDTKKLRPKGFPGFLGNDFILIGFRIFVRYITNNGKRLRGLYILRSETNKRKMSFFGNIFTHYNYSTTDIRLKKTHDTITVLSGKSRLNISARINKDDISIPNGSPFKDWKEARRFAGPLPYTFTYNAKTEQVLIIEGVRENWTPKAAAIEQQDIGFIDELSFKGMLLANAFVIEQVPYYWKKGRIEIWKG